MICPSCGTRNNYYHRYCYYCGYKLIVDEVEIKSNNKEKLEQSSMDEKMPEQDLSLDLFKANNKNVWEDEDLGWLFEEPDYTQQFPLRRHRKDRSSSFAKNVVKICTTIIFLATLLFISYIIVDQIWRSHSKTDTYRSRIIASTFVDATTIDGKPAHRIVVNTSNGEKVEALDKVYPVVDGKAEIVYEDAFLYSYFSQGKDEDEVKVQLDITIYGKGLPESKKRVEFTLKTPLSPLTLIQPASGEALVEGKKYRIILEVEPGSQVFINGNNYSDLVDQEGRLEKDIEVPNAPENIYEIKVSKRGYADHIRTIVLKREVSEVPLIINQSIPVQTTDEWAKITGTTHPQAELEVSLEPRSQPSVDPETGNFTLYVRAAAPGYTPCTITAHVEGKDDAKINLVIDRQISEGEYTRRAWAFDYAQLKSNPDLHNGRIFVLEGVVKDIIALGDKNIFTIDVSANGPSPQMVYVEHWGNLSIRLGNKVRIFGNRWGNYEDMPRILAKYVYRY
ncbi:hypothetical protein JOD02_000485 [Caldicoprobacter guelmensis]|uniref:zinc ribbon domain-containing protein n=1 Tax=Caldicoprobacter guelmensis TaxID=1170224 RepID=UPI00195E40F3|nr:zinc ribbon domain-containing protein [Caldicoprobacter guelmensis]MBM7581662.1 hypothetical protein [Caldicoprobacter guelmensis]